MELKELLSPEISDQVTQAVIRGRYSLLLGSGFSATSKSKDGNNLPLAAQLAEELANAFKLPTDYGLAHLADAVSPSDLSAFLTRRFHGCTPSAAALKVPTFVWSCVYTLNVDDVLSRSYEQPDSLQHAETLTFRTSYTRPEDNYSLQIVCLHGTVVCPNDGYVFSLKEYGESAASDSTWFKIFADELSTRPFIVLGCSLSEPDLEYYLARRRDRPALAGQIAPSLFITPFIDKVIESRCSRFGLIPVVCSSDDFIHSLDEACTPRLHPTELVSPKGTKALFGPIRPSDQSQRIVYRQWYKVDTSDVPEPLDNMPLLRGTEPTWKHLLRTEDVIRKDSRSIVAEIGAWLDSGSNHYVCQILSSAAGEGKTVALMRCAMELASRGVTVLFYTAKERMVVESLADVLARMVKKCVLVVDNVATHAVQLFELLGTLPATCPGVYVLGGDRNNRVHWSNHVRPDIRRQVRELQSLTLDESLGVVQGLRSAGLLGEKAGSLDQDLARTMQERQLIAAVAEAGGSSVMFEKQILDEWKNMDDAEKSIYECCALAHSYGYPIRSAVLQNASGVSGAAIARAPVTFRGILRCLPPTGEYFECRHRVVAEMLISSIKQGRLFKRFVDLSLALAPYVTRSSIMKGLPEAKLAGLIMDWDDSIGKMLTHRAHDFYEAVKHVWSWNSRYWEQCALLEMRENPMRAVELAEQAVGIEQHPHTFTTLAKVEFEVACTGASGSDHALWLGKGIEHIREAIHRSAARKRAEIHPYDVCVRGVSRYRELTRKYNGFPDVPSGTLAEVEYLLNEVRARFGFQEYVKLDAIWKRSGL